MRSSSKPSVNGVIEKYSRKRVRFTVKMLGTAMRTEEDTVVIEGEAPALEFLGNLLLAQAHAHDDGFGLSPSGAGKVFFTPGSVLGIYLHRLPCASEPKR